jgi:hypothetical protein
MKRRSWLCGAAFFDNATPLDSSLNLERPILNARCNPCLEAFGIVLAHELVRLDAGATHRRSHACWPAASRKTTGQASTACRNASKNVERLGNISAE